MSADKKWPALGEARLLGTRIERIDGPDKVTGRAKYTYDIHRPNLAYAKFALCPHGHAKVKTIDLGAAEDTPGVLRATAIVKPGDEIRFGGQEVAVVCADTEEAAREGARRVVIEYDVLPHLVDDTTDELPASALSKPQEKTTGDPDAAFAAAKAVSSDEYGCPIITHCCLESHGSVVEFTDDDHVTAWVSTQNVSGIAEEVADPAGVVASDVHVICQHLGGGFGSKFGFGISGNVAAQLAKVLKRPVKVMLDRDHELISAGHRASGYAKVKVGAAEDGSITAWESRSWGFQFRGALPYVFKKVPNLRTHHVTTRNHFAGIQAWRAPDHPQQCLITMSALEDAAAKLGMDPLAFFKKNLGLTDLADVYAEELDIAAGLIGWKDKWKPRTEKTGTVRSGVGLSLHTWGGGGHESTCRTTIRNDGSVEVACGTQDLGVGTRTVLAIVTAETLGLPVEAITVKIGDNSLPQSGASGGSTTVGGISSSSRTAAVAALNALFEKCAGELGGDASKLSAHDGRIVVTGDASKSLAWADACRLVGATPVVGDGKSDRSLMDSGVGGVQMAEVEVDVETGIVKMKKMVAVQDCGLVVDLKTAESQVYGACIMGITSALFEQRVMDPVTGRLLNPDMEFYRLAGIGDIGEIQVHMMQTERHWKRGVIGLGEPPVISPLAAISNAVANAVGVRVPFAPFTPKNVLAALGIGGAG